MAATRAPVQVINMSRASYDYSITFNEASGNSVLLAQKGGTYVATVTGGSTKAGNFTSLAAEGKITFDFDSTSKAAGVSNFQSMGQVVVTGDHDKLTVYGSNYDNDFEKGERFVATDNGSGVFSFDYSMNYLMIVNGNEAADIEAITIYYECGTQSNPDNVTSLSAPTGLAYNTSTNVLSYNAVSDALGYEVTIKDALDAVVETMVIEEHSVNLDGILEAGAYTAEVRAKHNDVYSTKASYNFKYLYVDNDMILEAETNLLDRERNYSADANAHGGAYGLAFNDCGQGMYFRYYAFEAGNRDITVTYSTGSPNSFLTLFVNGTYVSNVWFTENTGWFGDTHVTADVTIEDVALVQGWNEFYLIKNGSAGDNPAYGGYAQVDYITVEGTGNSYDVTAYDRTSYTYNLECEAGHWHYTNSSIRPERWGGSFSLGFGLGTIDNVGDGVRFDVNIAEAGTYALRPVTGGPKDIGFKIDNGDVVNKNYGAETGWNVPVMAANDIYQVELTAGHHTIDWIRNGNWICMDKLVLEKVA